MKKINTEVYVPMFGFKNLDEYLETGRLTGDFHMIKVPKFCLSSNDDNITAESCNPYKEV